VIVKITGFFYVETILVWQCIYYMDTALRLTRIVRGPARRHPCLARHLNNKTLYAYAYGAFFI
jgi:hypothetical protein